jgi:MFS family permease
VLIGSLIVVFNVVALFLLDRVGRRPLLLASISAMGLTLLHLGYSFGATDVSRITVLLDFLAYLAAFCLGLGPVFWLLISEIYPTTIRAQAMSVASSVIWAGDLLVTITFLSLMEALGARHAFWLYGALCGLALLFALRMVPETKDRTLEQIEASWSTVPRDR